MLFWIDQVILNGLVCILRAMLIFIYFAAGSLFVTCMTCQRLVPRGTFLPSTSKRLAIQHIVDRANENLDLST